VGDGFRRHCLEEVLFDVDISWEDCEGFRILVAKRIHATDVVWKRGNGEAKIRVQISKGIFASDMGIGKIAVAGRKSCKEVKLSIASNNNLPLGESSRGRLQNLDVRSKVAECSVVIASNDTDGTGGSDCLVVESMMKSCCAMRAYSTTLRIL
jgi:hypothetical protein